MTDHAADHDLEPDPLLDLDDDDRAAAPRLTLSRLECLQLRAALDAGLGRSGCDNTLRIARRWAKGAHVSWPGLRSQLEDNGGFCDCEVVFNVVSHEEAEPD